MEKNLAKHQPCKYEKKDRKKKWRRKTFENSIFSELYIYKERKKNCHEKEWKVDRKQSGNRMKIAKEENLQIKSTYDINCYSERDEVRRKLCFFKIYIYI